MTLDYYNWLLQQPERQKLEKQRDELREQFQKLERNSSQAMRKSFAYYASADRIEEARDEWQCTSNENDEAMHKIYGIHPELFVDYQMDVVVKLRQLALEAAQGAIELNKNARSTKQEFDNVVDEITKQYDAFKPKWEALQNSADQPETKEESK
tara:strand:- start:1327 stop:1788 length:462 start_codon:yes stop_codon:yes gene_type:complete